MTADNKSKLYGENLPTFTSTVTVDGNVVPVSDYGLYGLGGGRLQYTTPANSLSDATNYTITPALNPALDPTISRTKHCLNCMIILSQTEH